MHSFRFEQKGFFFFWGGGGVIRSIRIYNTHKDLKVVAKPLCEKGWQRGRKEKQLLCGHSCSAFILLPLQILFRLGKQRQEEEMMDRKQKKKGGEKFTKEMPDRVGALSVPRSSYQVGPNWR